MNLKKQLLNPYGLRKQFGITLAVSSLICIAVFFALNAGLNFLFVHYYEHSDFEQTHIRRQYENLQNYIDTHYISSQNLEQLKEWEKKQPVVLLELYADGTCIYSSVYDVPVSISMLEESTETTDMVTLKLADCLVSASLYSDFTYQFHVLGTAVSIIMALVLFILLFLHSSSRLIGYICRLNEEVQILEGGNLEYCVSEEGNDEITDLARSMNRMRVAFQQQMETEQQLYQSNRRLITEMSHDLRTPLTGIMLYLEILRTHRYETEEQLQRYLGIIEGKARHMKVLSDHLFEYSAQEVHEKQEGIQSAEKAFCQELTSMQDELTAQGYTVESQLEWKSCYVQVNPEYIHRIIENIVSNIEKYAEKSAEVRIEMLYPDEYCGFSVTNTSLADRDSVESNGIGIESICTMMRQMNGSCSVERTDHAFEITILFPVQ